MAVSATVIGALIGAGGLVISGSLAAWASIRSRREHSPADLQGEINEGFREFMQTAGGRIKELEKKDENCQRRLAFLEGRIRGLQNYVDVLIKLLRGQKINVPPMPEIPYFGDLPPHNGHDPEDKS